jgi:hypothetical protein
METYILMSQKKRKHQSTSCLLLRDMGCRLKGKTSEFDSEKRSSNLLSPAAMPCMTGSHGLLEGEGEVG